MPRTDEICESAKYSNTLTTSCHDTAKPSVTISLLDVQDLFDITRTLKGEEAVEQASVALDYHNNVDECELALINTIRFYRNVRYLVSRMEMIFDGKQ